ncbi:MAG: ribonuclease III [Rhodocyclales bacterium RIFCSPLOWO2_02_FULL_63_24]|nr:MAG: ribonuclease III [Rhodocyclales bacterium GWA2_65_19]OHC67438.1 MAG: ribonuclease III [Rhodocyclales bacterium RIFCSPLOWO2_02_FULL_63_24]
MKPQRLEAALGHGFGRPELLRQALTHRSFGSPHNERLEFLGDSVLNCAVAAYLHQRFAALREGELSRLRATLVRQETLADIALNLGLGDYLQLGEGELKSGGARRPSILADALEAIFGAIYVDAGFDAARTVIERLYQTAMSRIDANGAGKDPKTALQEVLQGRHLPLPRYGLLATHGEAHAQEFEVECVIPDLGIRSTGTGGSRRIAEQQAAQRAIAEIKP